MCDVPASTRLLGGKDVVSALASETASYDLLIMSMPDQRLLTELLGSRTERIIARAECSVLALKTPRVRTHEAFQKRDTSGAEHESLLKLLHPEGARAGIDVSRKDAAFAHFASVFEQLIEGVSQKQIVDALLERERTQNTSLGHGVALPHATLSELSATVVGVFTSKQPIDYQGPDGSKVDVFFVTVSPPAERNLHLKLLSNIATLSLQTPLLMRLREAETGEQLKQAISDCSREAQAN
jgi:PTS system nitrogen regulatory IIA component